MKRNYALRRALARALKSRQCPAETADLGLDPLVYGAFGRFRLRPDDWREVRAELARMREAGFVRCVPGYEETWMLDGELRAAMDDAASGCGADPVLTDEFFVGSAALRAERRP